MPFTLVPPEPSNAPLLPAVAQYGSAAADQGEPDEQHKRNATRRRERLFGNTHDCSFPFPSFWNTFLILSNTVFYSNLVNRTVVRSYVGNEIVSTSSLSHYEAPCLIFINTLKLDESKPVFYVYF